MKDDKLRADDKLSSIQQIHVLDVYMNRHSFEKNWTHMPSTSGSYGRQAG